MASRSIRYMCLFSVLCIARSMEQHFEDGSTNCTSVPAKKGETGVIQFYFSPQINFQTDDVFFSIWKKDGGDILVCLWLNTTTTENGCKIKDPRYEFELRNNNKLNLILTNATEDLQGEYRMDVHVNGAPRSTRCNFTVISQEVNATEVSTTAVPGSTERNEQPSTSFPEQKVNATEGDTTAVPVPTKRFEQPSTSFPERKVNPTEVNTTAVPGSTKPTEQPPTSFPERKVNATEVKTTAVPGSTKRIEQPSASIPEEKDTTLVVAVVIAIVAVAVLVIVIVLIVKRRTSLCRSTSDKQGYQLTATDETEHVNEEGEGDDAFIVR